MSANTRAETRLDAGSTLVSTLAAMVVGILVIGGLSLFWLNSTKSASRNGDVSNQEASALRVLNGVAGDINSADSLIYASEQAIVAERDDATGKIIRTRYLLDKTTDTSNFKIVRTINKNSPTGTYAESTTFPASGVGTTSNPVAQKAKDVPLFNYFTKDGDDVAGIVLDSVAIKTVQRVDINFKADAGKGYVELSSKASLGEPAAAGDGDDPPQSPGLQCPSPSTAVYNAATDNVDVSWSKASDVDNYYVIRNGNTVTPLGPIADGPATFTYSDTTAPQGQTNTYRVEPRNSGDANPGCVVRSVNVPPSTPVVSGKLESSTSATGTDSVMSLSWTAVSGASSYLINYRTVDPKTLASSAGFSAVRVYGTTYQFAPGLDQAREFYVRADSPVGLSPPSPSFKLLSKPSAPALTSTAARVTGYSQNTFSWSPTPSSTSYYVYRYSNRPGYTYLPLTYTFTATTYTDVLSPGGTSAPQDWLGYTYHYLVYSVNNGPRSFNGTSAVTGKIYGNFTNYSNYFDQYPADPGPVTATGSEVNADGTNNAKWGAGRGAETYKLYRTWKNGTGTYADNGGHWAATVGNVLTYNNVGVPRGTRTYYKSVASNATGVSPNFYLGNTEDTTTNDAYQLPGEVATPDFFWGEAMPNLNDNKFYLQWWYNQPRYPDAGNPDDAKFCVVNSTTLCSYQIWRGVNDTAVPTNIYNLAARTSTVENNASYTGTATGWGASNSMTVKACNPGGCSDGDVKKIVNTYPAAFEQTASLDQSYGDADGVTNDRDVDSGITTSNHGNRDIAPQIMTDIQSFNDSGGVSSTDQKRLQGKIRMRWTKSTGAVSYDYDRQAVNDPANNGAGRTIAAKSAGNNLYTPFDSATPGATYNYFVYAIAANGLSREWDAPLADTNRWSGWQKYASVLSPSTTPEIVLNKALCMVYYASPNDRIDGKWGSIMIWDRGTIDPTVANSTKRTRVNTLDARNYTALLSFTTYPTDADRVERALTGLLSATGGGVANRNYVHNTATKRSFNYSAWTYWAQPEISSTLATYTMSNSNAVISQRAVEAPVAKGNSIWHYLRTRATPGGETFGDGWSIVRMNGDTKFDNAELGCPASRQPSYEYGTGGQWRNSDSYSYYSSEYPPANLNNPEQN